ncbi:MAG: ABC transporter permease [Gammaproteobacteria bacterium]|nr:ABC transporter permease [Gammaproteobacteria bacterium]
MRFKANYVAFKTILIKEVLRFMRIWLQTLLPAGISMGLYLLIFGNLIGSRMGDVQGIPYRDFIVPGIILMAVITNSYSNVVSSFYSTKYHRHVEEMLVSPVPSAIILWGYVAGGVARGLAVALVVTAVAMVLTDFKVGNVGLGLLVLLSTAILFSIAGLINALFGKSFDDISIVPTFVLTPLTYLGGVFFSIEMLPELWQQVSLFNPVLYMVNAFRFAMLGTSDVGLVRALVIIAIFILGLSLWALMLLKRGVGIKH